VLGFSQGVAAACRLAALGSTRVHRLILWGGSLATDLPGDGGSQVFRGASVTLVAGRTDAIVPVKFMEKQRVGLAERGIAAELFEYDGGHSLNSEMLRALSS
jgi:predicted esterase